MWEAGILARIIMISGTINEIIKAVELVLFNLMLITRLTTCELVEYRYCNGNDAVQASALMPLWSLTFTGPLQFHFTNLC